jgi:hypothetical protein
VQVKIGNLEFTAGDPLSEIMPLAHVLSQRTAAERFGDITDEIFTIMRRWIAEAGPAGEPKVTAYRHIAA